ncbi:MAG: hypothetical protein PHN76_06500 [Advenella sp.]|uniref:hypothetical protein n=1 Tax=Advenella TaxID=290425 RepID=UPI002584F59C|nr:hypothetical protein [Advenella sp.]MDD3757798.1 hypothetical protein [Advenella sp.]
MKLIKTVKPFIALVFGTVVLSGCTPEPYPPEIKTDLISLCMEGILSGQTNVVIEDNKTLDASESLRLCEFRYGEFIKKVPLADYLDQQTHLYESFQRAYRQKYILEDVYNSLSPKDKKTFATTSQIMLGLDAGELE